MGAASTPLMVIRFAFINLSPFGLSFDGENHRLCKVLEFVTGLVYNQVNLFCAVLLVPRRVSKFIFIHSERGVLIK